MKVAVSASTADLSSAVDPRFGRCSYFLFVDPETKEFEAVENPNVSSASGAGIQAAQLVASKGVKAVLTGSCGPNAFQTLEAAGIQVIVGVSGTAEEAVQKYQSGQLKSTAQPNVPSHFGMGMGADPPSAPGFGMGRGMGRGMGQGRGRGMRSGMGYSPFPQASGMPPFAPPMSQLSPEEELKQLKSQADWLRKQMESISKRIEELEKNK